MGGCFNLGLIEEKLGNAAVAKMLYKKACDAGEMQSCSNLGLIVEKAGKRL
jgi:TPR repeat protein